MPLLHGQRAARHKMTGIFSQKNTFGLAMTSTFELLTLKTYSAMPTHDEYLCQVLLKSIH